MGIPAEFEIEVSWGSGSFAGNSLSSVSVSACAVYVGGSNKQIDNNGLQASWSTNYVARITGGFSGYSENVVTGKDGKVKTEQVPFNYGGINTTFTVPHEYHHA